MSAVDSFSQKFPTGSHKAWPSVRLELRWARDLLALQVRPWRREWSSCVACTDASELGRGVVDAHLPASIVRGHGEWNERWRFKNGGERVSARVAVGVARADASPPEQEKCEAPPPLQGAETPRSSPRSSPSPTAPAGSKLDLPEIPEFP
eukprot:7968998-Pyramimonas_sp.AAC.1